MVSAFPAELGRIFAAATLDKGQPVVVDGRSFYQGRLEGHDVIMALTGIGPVNANATTEAAFAHFRCPSAPGRPGISGVVFSGVAGGGGPSAIGDVTIPSRWTQDNGATWQYADPAMQATAARVAPSVKLEHTTPLGDPACTCQDPGLVKTVTLTRAPKIIVGGDGTTTDPFGGRAVPCFPGAGDLGGCQPCRASLAAPSSDARRFVTDMRALADPGFFAALIAPAPASSRTYVASDEETAAVARVAVHHGTPFVAFRAISDGAGDPLMLPGFPSQFFVYKQLAADNAAAAALAFLRAWPGGR